jgi:hypothetical protein
MTTDATAVALAAVIDALALVQGQLDRLERSNGRIEAAQRSILDRLDTIDAGQAAVTELVPVLEMILARSIEDREAIDSKLSRIAQVAAFAHAASLGNGAPLPVAAADDPLLEQFLLTQPADRISVARALIDWRGIAAGASSADLTEIIARQYQPSPTDTAETRVLRYQLAAITRAELQGRGAYRLCPRPRPGRRIGQSRRVGRGLSSSRVCGQQGKARRSSLTRSLPARSTCFRLPSGAEGTLPRSSCRPSWPNFIERSRAGLKPERDLLPAKSWSPTYWRPLPTSRPIGLVRRMTA